MPILRLASICWMVVANFMFFWGVVGADMVSALILMRALLVCVISSGSFGRPGFNGAISP